MDLGSEHDELARKLSTKSSNLRDESANDNSRVIARFFERNAALLRTSVSNSSKPKPVQEVLKLWEAVHVHLAPKFPLPRGADIDDFQPNKHILKMAGPETVEEFLQQSDVAIARASE